MGIWDRFRIILWGFGGLFGSFWDVFGLFCGHLVGFLAAVLGYLDQARAIFGSFLDYFVVILGSFPDRFGTLWDRFGVILGSFCGHVGGILW